MQQSQKSLLTDACVDRSCTRLGLAQETLKRFGRLRFKALGSSMLPAVAAGDILTFRPPRPGDLMAGRIVLVQDQTGLVAHRLISHEQGLLTTMGDSLRDPDSPLAPSCVLGVLSVQQRGSQIIRFGRDHRRKLPSASRWLLRHFPLMHRIARRWPGLVTLTA